MQTTHFLAVGLASPLLFNKGLGAVPLALTAPFNRQYGLEVTIEADPAAEPEGEDLRVFLCRAVRELLLNAVKHADGGAVRLSLAGVEGLAIRIIVADQGSGFDPSAMATLRTGVGGFGLANIRERLACFGGELLIESSLGLGARPTVLAPLELGKKSLQV